MSNDNKVPHLRNVPKLRFTEFTNEYNDYKLSELMVRYSEHNKDEEFTIEDILSLSSQHGVVDRKELLEDTYSKVNHLNYIKTRLHDFIYGKSISASYPYGLFKANRCRDGLLSTLYFTFKTYETVNAAYLDKYFSYYNRANNFLRKYVLVGDRYITADANYILSGTIAIPRIKEQNKIVELFDKLDIKIAMMEQKLEALKLFKKGLLELLYVYDEELPKLRFKGYFTKYNCTTLGREVVITGGGTPSTDNSKYWDGNIQWFTPTEIGKTKFCRYSKRTITEIGLKNSSAKLLSKGTILLSTRATIGESSICIDEASTNQGFQSVTVISNDRDYIYYLLKSKVKDMFRFATGSTFKEISKKDLSKLKIALPELSEQNKVSKSISLIDQKLEFTECNIETLKQFKKGLLQQMFV